MVYDEKHCYIGTSNQGACVRVQFSTDPVICWTELMLNAINQLYDDIASVCNATKVGSDLPLCDQGEQIVASTNCPFAITLFDCNNASRGQLYSCSRDEINKDYSEHMSPFFTSMETMFNVILGVVIVMAALAACACFCKYSRSMCATTNERRDELFPFAHANRGAQGVSEPGAPRNDE